MRPGVTSFPLASITSVAEDGLMLGPIWADRGDLAGANRHIGHAVDALGRIENAATFNDKIVLSSE